MILLAIKIDFCQLREDYIWFGWLWIGGWSRLGNPEFRHIIIKRSSMFKHLYGARDD